MGYYKSPIEFLRNFPKSVIQEMLGMENPDDLKMKDKYNKAMKRYRDEYEKALNLGITEKELKTLGVERPALKVLASGVGAGGGGMPFIPILSTGVNLPAPTADAIRNVEMKIRNIEDAEEKKANPPQPPVTENSQSRLNQILDKYKNVSGEINDDDWDKVQNILDEELQEFKENPDIDLSNVDTSLEDDLEAELERMEREEEVFKPEELLPPFPSQSSGLPPFNPGVDRIMTTRTGQNKGLNNSVTLQILERLLTLTKRASLRLNVPTQDILKKYPAFRLNKDRTFRKNQTIKLKKKNKQTMENTILRRIWTNNNELWQDIIDILQNYGGLERNQIQDLKTNSDSKEIGNIADFIYNRSGINTEDLNRRLITRLRQSATDEGAPEWFISIFDNTPMNVTVDNPPMPPSIKDDTVLRVLVRTMRQQLIDLGIPEFDAQEMSLRLIEHFASQEQENIAEAGDFKEGVNRTITKLLDQFNSVIEEATQRLTGSFTVNRQELIKLMKNAFFTFLQEKNKKLSFLQKIKVFKDLINQVVTKVSRNSSSSSSGAGFQPQPVSISPNELAQEIKNDEKMDVVRGRGIRIRRPQEAGFGNQIYNIDDLFRPEDLLPNRSGFDGGGDDDPDFEDPNIPEYIPDPDFINPFPDPRGNPGGDPPPDPPGENMVDFFFRGSWRRISLKTLIRALIIAGATTTAIYEIYDRLSKQEDYTGEEDNDDNDNDDDEENNPSINIEDNTNTMIPTGMKPIGNPVNPGGIRPGGVYYNPIDPTKVQQIGETGTSTETSTGTKENELSNLRKRYLELYQNYLDAMKQDANKDDLQSIFKQIIEVRDRIEKLKGTAVDETVEEQTNGEVPVAAGNDDDEHTMVQFDEDHEQLFMADIEDPAEANLFLSTSREADEEQKRWENYSLVRPGFGLGNVNQNPLAMHNYQQEKKRFTNCFKSEKPGKAPTFQAIERKSKPQNQPFWIPAIMNEYGQVQFEDSFYNMKMCHAFTDPVPNNNERSTFENSNSIYFPENSLSTHKQKSVRIPEIRTRAGYYGVNKDPSTQGGYSNNRKVFDTMYQYSPMMSEDFKHKKQDISNNINYSLPRNGSARF